MMDIVEHYVVHNELLLPIFLTFDLHDEILYIVFHHAMVNDIESTKLNYIQHIELLSGLVALIDKVQYLQKSNFILNNKNSYFLLNTYFMYI